MAPVPQPKPADDGWTLDELRREIQKGIDSGERDGYLDGEEVMAEILGQYDDIPDEPDPAE